MTGDRIARARFGAAALLVPVSTPAQVVTAVTSGDAAVGLVPVPRQDDPTPWWPLLIGRSGDTAVRVAAGVPFVRVGDGEELSALIIARGEAEPSGDDRSVIVIECDAPFSRDRVREVFTENGFDPTHTLLYDDPDRPDVHFHLAEVDGYVALDDPRLDSVRRALPASSVSQIGAYATPLNGNAD